MIGSSGYMIPFAVSTITMIIMPFIAELFEHLGVTHKNARINLTILRNHAGFTFTFIITLIKLLMTKKTSIEN